MQIGRENWCWVTIDSPGVPTGGIYGNPGKVAEKLTKTDYKLAWSMVWECFLLYYKAGENLKVAWRFKDWTDGRPIPVTEDFLIILNYMKEQSAGLDVSAFLKKLDAEECYEAMLQQEADFNAMEPEIMRSTMLELGLEGSKEMVIVPAGIGAAN